MFTKVDINSSTNNIKNKVCGKFDKILSRLSGSFLAIARSQILTDN